MKLIIDIPDDYMKHIDIYEKGSLFDMVLTGAIKNGTPLPEGHGRLIDADAYRKEMLDSREFDFFKRLDMQPTIIEADKAESEG